MMGIEEMQQVDEEKTTAELLKEFVKATCEFNHAERVLHGAEEELLLNVPEGMFAIKELGVVVRVTVNDATVVNDEVEFVE